MALDQLAIQKVVDLIDDHDYAREWNILAFGHELPDGISLHRAVFIVKEIWTEAMLSAIKGRPEIIYSVFCNSLMGRPVTVNPERIPITLDDFIAVAVEEGVDIQVESWLDGVPLEYILAK